MMAKRGHDFVACRWASVRFIGSEAAPWHERGFEFDPAKTKSRQTGLKDNEHPELVYHSLFGPLCHPLVQQNLQLWEQLPVHEQGICLACTFCQYRKFLEDNVLFLKGIDQKVA